MGQYTGAVLTFTPRWYQRAAVDAVFGYFAEKAGNPVIVVPTGGGKSLIASMFVKEACEHYPGTRILVLQHVEELLSQNYAELCALWPLAPAGLYAASLGRRQSASQILFASIQSVHGRAAEIGHVDLVLIDECHMVPRDTATTYRKLLEALRKLNPYIKVVGMTATDFRTDSGELHRGDDAMFDDVAYEVPIRVLFDEGWLCPPVTPHGSLTQISTTGLHTSKGDYVPAELASRANDAATVNAICDEIVRHGQDRAGWLIFGAGKENSRLLGEGVRERGISCEMIYGDTPRQVRRDIVAAFKGREIRALSSMGVLTTGFNAKHVDMIAVARPTKSATLWVQMLGRGTRCIGADIAESTANGKSNFLVLDFGGNSERLGPIDRPNIRKQLPGDDGDILGDAPTKACLNAPTCQCRSPAAARACVQCGEPFPAMQPLVATEASAAPLLYEAPQPQWVDVTKVTYRRHDKEGKPPSMRVTYRCGLTFYDEWIGVESDTARGRAIALAWWKKRTDGGPMPGNIDDAVRLANYNTLRVPSSICVRPSGKYFTVCGHQFA